VKNETKKCSRCHSERTIKEFGINPKNGCYFSLCPNCRKSSGKKSKHGSMQEPTIKLTWKQLLVRGEIVNMGRSPICH